MSFAHLTLAVPDVRRAEAFFERALGWRIIPRPNNIGRPATWLEIAPGQELHLLEVPDFVPSPFEKEFGRHCAFAVAEADFPALKERLKMEGAEIFGPLRPTPFARFFFRTPEGYVFEVVAADRPPEFGGVGP